MADFPQSLALRPKSLNRAGCAATTQEETQHFYYIETKKPLPKKKKTYIQLPPIFAKECNFHIQLNPVMFFPI